MKKRTKTISNIWKALIKAGIRRAKRRGLSHADAEDVCQDTAIKIIERPRSKYLLPQFFFYLMNTIKDLKRKRAREAELFGYSTEEAPSSYISMDDIIDPSWTDPSDELEVEEKMEILEHGYNGLSHQQQEVFRLCVVEEHSTLEVAEGLKVSEGTVKQQLSRARQKLARTIGAGKNEPS